MGVLLLVLLFGALLLPLLKIAAVTAIVKLGAAITGIVSDKRISECADRVGRGGFLLLRCVFYFGGAVHHCNCSGVGHGFILRRG